MKKIKDIIKFVLNKDEYLQKELKASTVRYNKIFKKDFLVPIKQFSDDDVFIVGFPKSGNTWMQTLMSCILFGIDAKYMSDKLAQEIVPDVHARTYYKRFNSFNFFKSHDLPKKEFRKVIYIVRDGRDAITSYLHFRKNLGQDVKLSDFYTDESWVFPTFWHLHVKAWLENPYNADILYVRYEDLLKNTHAELQRIMQFVGVQREPELIDKIVEGSSITNMRKRVAETGGMGNHKWTGEKGAKFFRKGKIGDYVNHMTKEEIKAFNEISKKELSEFGYLDS